MIISVNDITSDYISELPIQKRKVGNPSKENSKWHYKDIVCAFDIETSRYKIGEHNITKTKIKDDYIALMYIWQFQIGLDLTIIGRTWEEFTQLMEMINNGLNKDERLLIFIHNLSHEFQFLRDKRILGEHIKEDSVFILSSRKILRFIAYDKIEFRCSYIHSNMSLGLFTDKMGVTHKKLSGDEYNYNILRFPWSEIKREELEYAVNDVLGLVECIYKEMEIDGDSLYSLPLTSTGYVRRDIRAAIKQGLPRNYIEERKPDYETYDMLNSAFRGGNTHANRFIAGRRVEGNIKEFDRSSSYPDVQLNRKFPIGKYHKPKTIDKEGFENCLKKDYAIIARLCLYNLELKDEINPVPYISLSKCENIKPSDREQRKTYRQDNGRILSAECVQICVTEIDLDIIFNQYNVSDYLVLNYRWTVKGYLPECIKEVIRGYYTKKTELKGSEDETDKIIYMKSKNKLNSIYGNSAQNPGKLSIYYKDGNYITGYRNGKTEIDLDKIHDEIELNELYVIVYDSSDTVLPYQWGVYTTSWARYELQVMIDLCGDNFLYCDTDAVYFVDDGTIDFSQYNKRKIESSTKTFAYADDKKGNRHYMGVAECEHEDITAFITWGAKKYAFIDTQNKLHITISGVSKKYSVGEVENEFDENIYTSKLNVMQEGFTFYKAGGNELVYNDIPIEHLIIEGHDIYIPSNVVILPSTYKLHINEDYADIIEEAIQLNYINIFNKLNLRIPIDISELL